MDIESLESLTRQHTTTAVFGPHRTGESSLRWIQDLVAVYDLSEEVPEGVRGYLEVARRLHIHGYFEYSFFTVATERATFAAELGARQRLLDWYGGRVPIERTEGEAVNTDTMETTDTWNFSALFQRRHRSKWRLSGHPEFNGSFGAHLKWAQATLELGQYFATLPDPVTGKETGRLGALLELRNLAAHPSMDTRVGPIDSARSIRFAWRFINALWGTPAENVI